MKWLKPIENHIAYARKTPSNPWAERYAKDAIQLIAALRVAVDALKSVSENSDEIGGAVACANEALDKLERGEF